MFWRFLFKFRMNRFLVVEVLMNHHFLFFHFQLFWHQGIVEKLKIVLAMLLESVQRKKLSNHAKIASLCKYWFLSPNSNGGIVRHRALVWLACPNKRLQLNLHPSCHFCKWLYNSREVTMLVQRAVHTCPWSGPQSAVVLPLESY